MKRKLGISIYPDHSDFASDKAYIKKASEFGFSRIFMSLLEITGEKKEVIAKYQKLTKLAKELNYEVILDVSPTIFNLLGISYDDLSFFVELGVDGLRLDDGFDAKKEALLSYNPQGLIIELNMSNDVAYVDNILTYQANKPFIYGCHNFYPQKGTGLPYDFFVKCSQRFKRNNLHTAAFISSQSGKIGPWSVNDGLPTLEEDRNLPIEVQAKKMFATGLIDDVIIGNSYASDEELKKLSLIDRYQVELKIDFVSDINKVEHDIVLKNQHVRRGDINEQVIRSTEVRKKYHSFSNSPHDNEIEFQKGDVVIGNNGFGKYKNELQIVLKPHKDNRKNLVGHINTDELLLLPFIKSWSKFKFVC